MTADKIKWMRDSDGDWLMLRTKDAMSFLETVVEGKTYDVEISIHHKKRSLNANAYLWVLCDRISDAVGNLTKEEVYRGAIKEVGLWKDFCGLSEGDRKTLMTAWSKLGLGWFSEEVGDDVRCYYGSSSYSTKQMSRLVDYIVADAKSVGVETMTPEQLGALVERWGSQ